MEHVDALDRSFAHAQKVIGGVRPDQLDSPTPCTEWDVRALLTHTIGVVTNIGRGVRGDALLPDVNAVGLGEDPGAQFAAAADATLAAWRAMDADTEVDIGAGPMPAFVAAGINLLDTTGHTWDLARATGQDESIPDDVVGPAFAAARMILTDDVRGYAGFAPEQPVAGDASPTAQFMAFMGRRP